MNFGQLKAEIRAVSHRDDWATGSRDAAFVARAEAMIAMRVRAVEMIVQDTLDDTDRVIPASASYNLPADLLLLRRAWVQIGAVQWKIELVSAAEMFPIPNSTGTYFGMLSGRRIRIAGNPAAGTQIGIEYFQRPAAMSADADAPALLLANPELYIHAALHWGYLDERDWDASRAHKEMFDLEVERVNTVTATAQKAGRVSGSSPDMGCAGSGM